MRRTPIIPVIVLLVLAGLWWPVGRASAEWVALSEQNPSVCLVTVTDPAIERVVLEIGVPGVHLREVIIAGRPYTKVIAPGLAPLHRRILSSGFGISGVISPSGDRIYFRCSGCWWIEKTTRAGFLFLAAGEILGFKGTFKQSPPTLLANSWQACSVLHPRTNGLYGRPGEISSHFLNRNILCIKLRSLLSKDLGRHDTGSGTSSIKGSLQAFG